MALWKNRPGCSGECPPDCSTVATCSCHDTTTDTTRPRTELAYVELTGGALLGPTTETCNGAPYAPPCMGETSGLTGVHTQLIVAPCSSGSVSFNCVPTAPPVYTRGGYLATVAYNTFQIFAQWMSFAVVKSSVQNPGPIVQIRSIITRSWLPAATVPARCRGDTTAPQVPTCGYVEQPPLPVVLERSTTTGYEDIAYDDPDLDDLDLPICDYRTANVTLTLT